MRRSVWNGLIILLIGVAVLLWQVPLGQRLLAGGIVWPAIWVGIGLLGAGGGARRRVSWWSVFCVAYGILLFLSSRTWVPMDARISASALFWAMLIIFAGLAMMLPHRRRPRGWERQVKAILRDHDAGDWHRGGSSGWHHVVGETVVGNQPWALPRDASIFTGLGESRVNLVTAHLEDGDYALDVSGWLGSIRILVPSGLAVQAKASLNAGQIVIFGDTHAGLGRDAFYQDPDYATATRRLSISSHLNLGQIDIVRV